MPSEDAEPKDEGRTEHEDVCGHEGRTGHEDVRGHSRGDTRVLERKIDALAAEVGAVRDDLRIIMTTAATNTARLDAVDRDVVRLNEVVRDGNGAPSVLARLATIEGLFAQHRADYSERNRLATEARRNFAIAIAAAIVPMVISAAVYLIEASRLRDEPAAKTHARPPAAAAPQHP